MSSTETPVPDDSEHDHHHSGISGWGIFLIILFVALVLAAAGYILYTRYRARKLGLPPPSLNPFSRNQSSSAPAYRAPAPAPGGIQGWISDKWQSLRNRRSAGGAYENNTGSHYPNNTSGGAGGSGAAGRRGFGALDPDEAWDTRVDHETSGYYEEQELGGLHQDPHNGPYGGGGYGEVGIGGIEEGRGRSRSRQRELDRRYDEEVHHGGGGGGQRDPFGDGAEPSNISLRSISPRPEGDGGYRQQQGVHKKGKLSLGVGNHGNGEDNSPTESRRSVFREDM